MRLNSSVTAPVVHSRPESSTPALAKSTAELTLPVDRLPVDRLPVERHPIDRLPVDHFIDRRPPFPYPFPRGDANARTQGRQLHDIAEGVRNGSLTAEEAQRLLQQQENISKATEQAMADGKLTREEALRLNLMQAQADLNIHVASNNGQRNLGAAWDFTAQQQARQIDQIAKGRANGNITAGEATELLDKQEDIADARGGANSFFEKLLVYLQQMLASSDISFHSLPGDQNKWGGWDWDFLPKEPMLVDAGWDRSGARPQVEAQAFTRGMIAG
jgi:hypothetical protein